MRRRSGVQMPNMNGLELTRRLRSEAATARMPIIMLSANEQADDILAGYAQGADEYVAKPVELAVLAAKVDSRIASHSSGMRLVTGADRSELAELVTVPAVHRAIDRLRASSDYVIVDTAATFTQHTLAAIDGADVLTIITSAHLASLKATNDLLSVSPSCRSRRRARSWC